MKRFAPGFASRLAAMVERQWVLVGGSWPRIVDLFYWPVVQILIWGFVQLHVFNAVQGAGAVVLGAVLGAVFLWDICWRSQLGLSLAYMEEIWSRNLGNLLVSPLRPIELLASLMVVSLMKVAIAMGPAALLAGLAFGFNVLSLGPALVLFVLNLVLFGWSLSLAAAGLVTRYGQGAQDMPWAIMFGLTPFCAVYYPVDTLPVALQHVANALPPAHVFEGLRALVNESRFAAGHLAGAFALNIVWVGAGLALYFKLLEDSRRRGNLVEIGE